MVPILGGVLSSVAFLAAPVEMLRRLWWMPLVVDLGCVPLMVWTAIYFAWRAVTKSGDGKNP
jgi:hypothetical protein